MDSAADEGAKLADTSKRDMPPELAYWIIYDLGRLVAQFRFYAERTWLDADPDTYHVQVRRLNSFQLDIEGAANLLLSHCSNNTLKNPITALRAAITDLLTEFLQHEKNKKRIKNAQDVEDSDAEFQYGNQQSILKNASPLGPTHKAGKALNAARRSIMEHLPAPAGAAFRLGEILSSFSHPLVLSTNSNDPVINRHRQFVRWLDVLGKRVPAVCKVKLFRTGFSDAALDESVRQADQQIERILRKLPGPGKQSADEDLTSEPTSSPKSKSGPGAEKEPTKGVIADPKVW